MVYFVATIHYDGERDNKDYLEYIEAVKPIVNKYHGRYIVRSEKITTLSTDWKPNRIIIIEFDTREQLEMCFSSEEYKRIAALRENTVDSRALIVE
ncbi:MAG: DUF1330 domain-containing protein [Wujia sp.]